MRYSVILATVMALPLALPAPADAATLVVAQTDGIKVTNVWARASAGNATNGAAYATLTAGQQPDQLLSATTPAAAKAEVHESFTDQGVMKMRPAPSLAIEPGKPLTLSPGGYHFMLFGLKQPLKADQTFPLTLTFAHAAPVTVDVHIQPLGQPSSAGTHMHMQ